MSLGLTHVSSTTIALSVMVAVIALILCLEAAVPLLSFIPGAFCGAAIFFGTAFSIKQSVICIVLGGLLGITSEFLGGKIQAAVDGNARGAVGPDPATAR